MLKWFDAAEAEKQADQAIEEVERLVPHAALTGGVDVRKKQIQKLDRMISSHRSRYTSADYNIYQKAKFANRVKWRLRDGGYPNDFIDSLVRLLII